MSKEIIYSLAFISFMQGRCIADIGSCGMGFDSIVGSVRTKKFQTEGSELAIRKERKTSIFPGNIIIK